MTQARPPHGGQAPTPPMPQMRVKLNLDFQTQGGIRLRTDAYLPPTGAAPVILVHTPYGRNLPILLRMSQAMCKRGLGVVLQDSRGRYQSEGEFDLYSEEQDCADTLAWLSEQEWCNGKLGLIGMSISTYSNFKVAGGMVPPGVDLGAVASIMGAASYKELFFRNGALILHWGLPWAALINSDKGRVAWREQPWNDHFSHLPLLGLSEHPELDLSEVWQTILSSSNYAPYWDDMDASSNLDVIEAPTLHLAGWYDFMLPQALAAYQRMAAAGKRQELIVGPWDHRSLFRSFGKPNDQDGGLDLMRVVVDFFSRWLLDGDRPHGAEATRDAPPVQKNGEVLLYINHIDAWLRADELPLPGHEIRDYFLAATRDARSLDGDGELVDSAPATMTQQGFVYDPRDPVPTCGGGIWPFDAAQLVPGPMDQTDVEERLDVLVFTGEPLDADLVVAGAVEVELWAATSAADTDFTAKLVDVDEDGVPIIVQDGIIRGRFSQVENEERLLQPNRPYRFRIDLNVCGHCFQAGHQLRLEVSSSNFPKFDRNLNSAAALYRHTHLVAAHQTVFLGGTMASRLRLSVLDDAAVEALRVSWGVGC